MDQKKKNEQGALERYTNIIKYHGLFRGLRRVFDQIMEVDLYDWMHGTNTRFILGGDEFFSTVSEGDGAATMHYQPVFTSAIRDPLRHLVAHHPVVGASSACFLDLGCGRGKALHVARSVLQHLTMIGVDLHPGLIADAARNLGATADAGSEGKMIVDTAKLKLIRSNVNDVDYGALLAPYDVVIVFNRNSFDKKTTEQTLNKVKEACQGKTFFYVYSNPVFEASFAGHECVFAMQGWHKGWNTKVFKIS